MTGEGSSVRGADERAADELASHGLLNRLCAVLDHAARPDGPAWTPVMSASVGQLSISRAGPMTTLETASMTDVPREECRPYFECPVCGVIGEPDSADYCLTFDREHVDWAMPMAVSCGSCRATSPISLTDVLERDAGHDCSRCGHRTACPASADRVVCWGCGLNSPGPASVGTRATYLRDVEHGADQWASAQVRVAKDSARDRDELPGWAS